MGVAESFGSITGAFGRGSGAHAVRSMRHSVPREYLDEYRNPVLHRA